MNNRNHQTHKSIPDILLLTGFALLCTAFRITSDWVDIGHEKASQDILEFNKQVLKSKSYSCRMTYKSYNGHASEEVYQQSDGYLIKDRINHRSSIMGKTTIQNKALRVVIDSLQKTVTVTNPLEGIEPNLNAGNFMKVMGLCKVVKRKTEGATTGYRFELKNSQGLIVQELFFDSKFFKRLNFYYANEHSLRENNVVREEVVYPKASIEFLDFKELTEVTKETFITDKVVTLKKGKLILASPFKNFKLIDGRYHK